MNQFNLPSCSSEDVMMVKKDIKTKSNNKSVQAAYQSLFGDTQIAVSNIQECLNNPNDIEQRLSLIHNGDVSFADDIIGLTPRGNGASRYRAFLALNERDILEIRIGNHYETEKVALAKSNNKAQFLCQVVLITTPPQPESDDAITSTTSVGNLHVLTKKLISSNSSIDDLRNVLISIKDYLISPTKSYEDSINDNNNNDIKTENYMRNNKRTIRLTESDLHRVIEESVKCVLNEGYTQSDINNTFQQWQQQGLQQIRNGYQNQQVRQNGGYNSLGHESAAYNASALVSKANKLYQYLMKNDIQSASQMLQPISELLETIETNILSHQRDQQYRNSMANNNSRMQ